MKKTHILSNETHLLWSETVAGRHKGHQAPNTIQFGQWLSIDISSEGNLTNAGSSYSAIMQNTPRTLSSDALSHPVKLVSLSN